MKNVQIQLDDGAGTGVNLRFVEAGGGVRVSVRTQDVPLAEALSANRQALESRLHAAGWDSEFRPMEGSASGMAERVLPAVGSRQENFAREEPAAVVVRGTQMQLGAGTGDSSGENPSTLADRNEDLLNAIALRRLANKGVMA
ncbi:MAG: hypothetical protein QM757_20210 [Paludibaculum sp.]